ncbi:hypothetical protein Tco_0319839 [Tanacetum coccineum]
MLKLTVAEINRWKQMISDIQGTIFSVFLEDIYAAVRCCENCSGNWLRAATNDESCGWFEANGGNSLDSMAGLEWSGIKMGTMHYRMSESVVQDAVSESGVQNISQTTVKDAAYLQDQFRSLLEIEDSQCKLHLNGLFAESIGKSEEQYTELLEPIPEPHQEQQNDSNVISDFSSVEQEGGTVDQHPATVEETRAYFESLYNNLALEVEKSTVGQLQSPFHDLFVTKKDVNSDSNGLSSTGVDNTAKTRRPQPRSNTKNDRVPSASKSSCIKNKEVEVEEHHRNLLLSKNKKHMSSECKHVKLDTRNDQSEVICAMCKQCLITANHDVCMLNYVNDMNSRGKKQKANVSNTENQKKQKPKVKSAKVIQICLWCVDSGCTLHLEGNLKLLINFVWKFLGTVRFGNDHVCCNFESFVVCFNGENILIEGYFVGGLGAQSVLVGRLQNEGTKKIMEIMNVTLDELSAMACNQMSDCNPFFKEKGSVRFSALYLKKKRNLLVFTSVDMIVMTSMVELESIFGHLFDELSNGENQVVSKSSDVTTPETHHV